MQLATIAITKRVLVGRSNSSTNSIEGSFGSSVFQNAKSVVLLIVELAFVFFVLYGVYTQAPKAISFISQFGASRTIEETVAEKEFLELQVENPTLPVKNSNLPDGNWLIIPKIGVRTQPIIAEDPADALNQGVWQAPEFAKPGDFDKPIIMAAHRYGFKYMWEKVVEGELYALRNIFYNLPELEVGDKVEIIHDQRRYNFEVYESQEGEEITDYNADLILYTCKHLRSDVRIIKYARYLE